jgi:hypothetical protein
MQSGSRYIIVAGIAAGFTSMLYFLSLVLHLPFFLVVPLVICFWVYFFTRQLRNYSCRDTNETKYPASAYLILIAGMALSYCRSVPWAYKYGGWDAWCIWNLHARFLAGGVSSWKNLFLNSFPAHPDYPLLTPGVIAFFSRLAGGQSFVAIQFIFSFSITLLVPVLVYLECLKKNMVVAVAAYLLIAADSFYLKNGVSQYADTTLAFFFLGALICIRNPETPRNIMLAAACLGCCMWTKNEGVVLAIIFTAFYWRTFFTKGNQGYFLKGLALPVTVFLVFKAYAPHNDMVSGLKASTFKQLLMKDRYGLIYTHLAQQLKDNYLYAKISFFLYLLVCLLRRKWPGRQFFLVVTCLIAYMMIYVLSVNDLEWHLSTSQDRLLHQLMPAAMFVFAMEVAGMRLSVFKKQALQH